MTDFTLVIGSKRFSTWSLRPWLVLRQAEIAFHEIVIPLRQDDTKARILEHSPSGKVPLLKHGDRLIWDSLAIVEYLAEQVPSLWPRDPAARAMARSVSAEMHSGFQPLRQALPMALDVETLPTPALSDDVQADIARIIALWAACRDRFGQDGPFLFGAWSIADAMYAPVATRLTTYQIPVDAATAAYLTAVYALPAMQDWIKAAQQEG